MSGPQLDIDRAYTRKVHIAEPRTGMHICRRCTNSVWPCLTIQLLDALDAAEDRLAAVEKLHPRRHGKDPVTLKPRDYCGNAWHPSFTPWPCDTIRAIGAAVEGNPE